MLRKLTETGFLALVLAASASAQHHYILNAPGGNISNLCSRYGLQYVAHLSGSAGSLYVVNSPLPLASVQAVLSQEPTVTALEEDLPLALPEASKTSTLAQMAPQPLPTLSAAPPWANSNITAWIGYLAQPAVSTIKIWQAHRLSTGAGIVAILDTGADFTHPALQGSLISGYDFINNIPMGQAVPVDLNQSTTSILDQSTTSILDQSTTSILDSNSTIILDQSTTSILDQSTTSILDGTKPTNEWGHGTMVAGVIHLVAPTAKLLPVKVFDSQGGSSLSLIVQGIHYAVDSGARVINMSFSMTGYSQALADAVAYASSQGVILVAAAGNEGQSLTVYPSGYPNVIGVAATDTDNDRASFSNFGPLVDLAAPGSAIITTYPTNRYAAGWGTSFSAPMVAGAAALFVQLNQQIDGTHALQAADHAHPLPGEQLGAGLLDLFLACQSLNH